MSIVGAIMVPHPPIILPEIGRGEEKKISATTAAYEKAADFVVSLDPETIIVSSPHSVMYYDYFHISPGDHASGNFAQFRAPQVAISKDYDRELVEEICRITDREHFPAGTRGEKNPQLDHGTMIPLYFIDHAYERAGKKPAYKIIRIGLSGESLKDHYRLGMMVREAVDRLGRRAVWAASGDLSHKCRTEGPYGYDPNGPEYDRRIMEVMGSAQFDRLLDFDESFCEKAAECGHRSFCMMAGALDSMKVKPEKLSHEDTFGVGYGVCIYHVQTEESGPSDQQLSAPRSFLKIWQDRQRRKIEKQFASQDPYVRLARLSLETWVRDHKALSLKEAEKRMPGGIPSEMKENRAGVFVSIHEDGRLRGCIGTISAFENSIAEEILRNAISAGTRDPRFDPIREEELQNLEYSVDVLGTAENIESEDQLDVKRYGVIVSKGGRRGLLLPNLDGVDTIADQVSIAKKKAGLAPDEQGCRLQRFEVVRHY